MNLYHLGNLHIHALILYSIMRVSLFGDDRDNLLARWNLLQASWGVGKAFYAQNQAPLSLNNENPLCRFKAIGYSAITSGSSDPELLSLIVKKKPAEVEAVKQNLTNDLQVALGNKPNIKVVINEVRTIRVCSRKQYIILHIPIHNLGTSIKEIFHGKLIYT